MAEGVIARLGRWCFRRRWWVLVCWLLAVGAGALASGPVFNSLGEVIGVNAAYIDGFSGGTLGVSVQALQPLIVAAQKNMTN